MNNYSKIIKPTINQLINDHTNLVKKISWHLHGRVNSIVDIEDIIQIGMLGLISAAQNYIPQKNASFASYASIRIKGEILDYLRKSSNLDRSTILIKNDSTHLLLNCIRLCEVTVFSPCYEQHIKTKKQDKTIEGALTLLYLLVQILKDNIVHPFPMPPSAKKARFRKHKASPCEA